MTRSRRSPRPLSVALDVARERWAPATLLGDVQRVWPEVVGTTIAREAQPVSEKRGAVTVSCSASVWAQELDLMAPTIIGRLNAALSGGQVERLRCVAVPPSNRGY